MGIHLDRALILLQQHRPELAERELRQELVADPDNARAHAILALCLSERKDYAEATEEAKAAIHLAPDMPFGHYALACILHERDRYSEAEQAVAEAIRLDPEDADYFALLAGIRISQRHWSSALEAAEQGLQLDAEHVACNNLRAMALVKLGRKKEAGATIATALARNPEDAVTHANQGWALLHEGNHQKALEHFREALRREPELDWARAGIVEALKAKHFLYGIMLRYFLWMARLSRRVQWAIILGLVIGANLLSSLADQHPGLAPWIEPILILYLIFAVLTWIASPLFNLLLRFNRFGRHALSRDQRVASNWLAGMLVPALVCLGLWLASGSVEAKIGFFFFGLLTMPTVAVFYCSPSWPRVLMAAYTIALAGVGLSPLVPGLLGMGGVRTAIQVFLFGCFLSGLVANALMMAVPRR